jgi:[ribosomal protein S18]-alanine N-acetyltransferase
MIPKQAGLVRAERGDSELLAEIHAAAFPPGESWSRDVFQLQLELPNVIALSDMANGLIMIRTAGDEAEVLTLAVRPAARREGRAKELLQEAIVRAIANGANVVFLEVSLKNTAARTLYQQFGFSKAGIRPRYYSDGTDALVMRLSITDPGTDSARCDDSAV